MRKTRTVSKSLLALKAEIHYHKTVLGVGGCLRLTGSQEQLFQSLMAHLGGPAAVDNDSGSDSDTAPAQSAVSARKGRDVLRVTLTVSLDQTATQASQHRMSLKFPFFSNSRCSGSVFFYDNSYYVGQVLAIQNAQTADVKFLEKTRGRYDFFRWPSCEDIAEVEAKLVFYWDSEVNIHSSDGHLWSVPEVKMLEKAYQKYQRIKQL